MNPYLAPLPGPTCDDRPLWDVWLSAHHASTLVAADELGLFPLLAETPLSVEGVASRLELSPFGAETMLGILASLGFLKPHGGRFHLADVSRNFLLPNSPFYWGGMLHRRRGHPDTLAIMAAVRDDPARHRVTDAWEKGEADPAAVRAFTQAMHAHSIAAAVGVARFGDFAGVTRLLDVGGGSGCFPIMLAIRYPELRATVMDLPQVCELVPAYAAEYGLADRIDALSVDMFREPWPRGFDAVFFSNIFHDWDHERCAALARSASDALPSGGRVYLHEMLLEDGKAGPLPASSFSMSMLLATRGKQWSAGELAEFLVGAGFSGITVTPTYGYYSLVSGRKP